MAGKSILDEAIASSSDDSAGTYQVFLSFRGKDTRFGFTDFLYRDLVAARVHTFRDDNELRVGEEIGPELIKAIQDSKISIPIFSKNYADSKWCLRELAQMVERRENWGQKIIPIFYDVEPSEVQHYERGSYNGAFVRYENNPSLDQKTIEEWKRSLAIVGELKGLELKKETNGYEGALVKIVVKKVLSELKKKNLHLTQTLVGIDNHMQRLKGLLSIKSNGVRIIGILGMSGLGKTTIAKAIYNDLNEFFDSHCFIEDVRGELQRGGLLILQNQLLFKILNRKFPEILNVDEGTDKIKDVIRGKKVFLVFDNVDDSFQVEKLAVNHCWYGAGSRIIITTTNEEVLLAIKVQCEGDGKFDIYKKYEPQLMHDEDALKLFSKCAFKRESPPEDYLKLAKEVVLHARGLPLVLETLGSSLCIENDKASWEEKLKKLQEIPPHKVLERLRISYDALDWVQKQIFLDIACFFVGVFKRIPLYMWDACGFHPLEGIKALVRRCLITVREDYSIPKIGEVGPILMMHDRLRELGKQIVKENLADPREWSRIWDHGEALAMVKEHQGLKNVEALCLNFDKPNGFDSCGAPSNSLFRIVRGIKSYLKQDWEYTYPRLAGHDFAKLPKLRYLSVAFADLFGDFKGLCSQLRWLQWRGCLGNSMPTNLYMKNLVIFELSDSRIKDDWKLWSQIKTAEKLKVLNISNCEHLESVPHLSNFTSLESLEINECRSLRRMDGLEQLDSLMYLSVTWCVSLERLPDLSKMGKLRMLNITGCTRVTEFQGLGALESLEHLKISYQKYLERIPDLSKLRRLRKLEMLFCEKLIEIQGLHGLESLEVFCMIGCSSIKRVTKFSNLKRLKDLIIVNCKELAEIQGLEKLDSLEWLMISECESLESLEINECWSLRRLDRLEQLDSLTYLSVTLCTSLERLPDLSKMGKLRMLTVIGCSRVTVFQGLDALESLEHLKISFHKYLERTPDLSKLRRLRKLEISLCEKLIEIQGLRGLESLEVFYMNYCSSIKRVTNFSNLKRLKDLFIANCEELAEIQGLEELESLERLVISECESIEKLPDLSNLRKVKLIDFSSCQKLTEIRGIEELKSLTVLRIQGCKSLKCVPNLPNVQIETD